MNLDDGVRLLLVLSRVSRLNRRSGTAARDSHDDSPDGSTDACRRDPCCVELGDLEQRTADAQGTCLERALEQGYAFRNAKGAILYRPYLPTAADYEACGIAVPANAVVATPGFAG